jgi:osmotically-inducible protein OsmY
MLRTLAALALLAAAAGCTPPALVLGAGARVGIAAFEDRGIDGTVEDSAIQVEVNAALIGEGTDLFWPITTLVRDGRLLLVGNVATEADRAEAARRVAAVDGVVEVFNELEVGPRPVVSDDAQDTLISQRVTSALVFDSEVKAVNYGLVTHNAVVYLMGTARSDWELERVVAHARNVAYVRGVVSHVQVEPVVEVSAPLR